MNKKLIFKTPKERDNLDLLELVCELNGRSLLHATEKLHDAYWEARNELALRLNPDQPTESVSQNEINLAIENGELVDKIQSLTQQLEEYKKEEKDWATMSIQMDKLESLESQLQQKEKELKELEIAFKTEKAMHNAKYQKISQLTKENERLKDMIDNGLGWEDMKNDITYPSEI